MANGLVALQVQQPDVANSLLRAAQIRALRTSIDNEQRSREATALFPQAVAGDENALTRLGQASPELFTEARGEIRATQEDERKRQKFELELTEQLLGGILSLPPGQRPAAYEMAKEIAQQGGLDLSQVPPQYDDTWAQQTFAVVQDANRRFQIQKEQMPLSPEQEAQKVRIAQAGRTQVNVGPSGVDYGDPGAGLVWQRDQKGDIVLDERGAPIAIPFRGGPAFQEQQAAAEASAAEERKTQQTGSIVLQDIDRALKVMDEAILPTTGQAGEVLSSIGGTGARDLRGLLDTVKANAGFRELQAMREASPTGGALGQVSEQEIAFLQAMIGNLEQSQSKEQLTYNLKRVRNVFLDIIHGQGNGPERAPLGGEQQPAQAGNPYADMSDEQVLEELRKQGYIQ